MLEHIPTLGARFDLKKIGDEQNCWQVFWAAVRPRAIAGASLFEGSIHRDDYCIAVQSTDPAIVDAVRSALQGSREFQAVCCPDPFIEMEDCIELPLPRTGRVDSEGNLIGDDKRMSNQVTSPVAAPEDPVSMDVMESASPMRMHPASERTTDLPGADSLEDLAATLKDRFVVHRQGFDRDIWITPKELCDLVEWYGVMVEVGLSHQKTEFSDAALHVRLHNKIHPDEHPILLEGFYIFKSRYAVTMYLQQFMSTPRYADALPDLAGIVGRFHLHFSDVRVTHGEDYSQEERISPDQLWHRLSKIRESFGDELVRALDILKRRREAEQQPAPSQDLVMETAGVYTGEPAADVVSKPRPISEEEKLARAEKKREEEEENERRRQEIARELETQEKRREQQRCIYCGKPLSFGEKRKQLDRHKDCWEFVDEY